LGKGDNCFEGNAQGAELGRIRLLGGVAVDIPCPGDLETSNPTSVILFFKSVSSRAPAIQPAQRTMRFLALSGMGLEMRISINDLRPVMGEWVGNQLYN